MRASTGARLFRRGPCDGLADTWRQDETDLAAFRLFVHPHQRQPAFGPRSGAVVGQPMASTSVRTRCHVGRRQAGHFGRQFRRLHHAAAHGFAVQPARHSPGRTRSRGRRCGPGSGWRAGRFALVLRHHLRPSIRRTPGWPVPARRDPARAAAAAFSSHHAQKSASRIMPYLITSASPAETSRAQAWTARPCRFQPPPAGGRRPPCSCPADD